MNGQFEPMNSESTHMEVCPACGYRKPAQNSFRPNVMSEYLLAPNARVKIVANNNDPQFTNDLGTWIRADLWTQYQASLNQPAAASGDPVPAPVLVPPTPIQQTTPAVLPPKPIPAGLMKTPDEIARSPVPTIAPVTEPQPVMSDKAAPVGLPKPVGPIGTPAIPAQP